MVKNSCAGETGAQVVRHCGATCLNLHCLVGGHKYLPKFIKIVTGQLFIPNNHQIIKRRNWWMYKNRGE